MSKSRGGITRQKVLGGFIHTKNRGPELVLGLPWLQGLGKIVQDYKKMEMKFMHEEENVKLIGNNSLGLQSFEAPSPP